jgi:hypothetical protein
MTETLPAAAPKPRWRLSAKHAALLIGFGLTALGLLGPQVYVTPVEDQAAEVAVFAKTTAARLENLRGWQSQYLMFEQIGALVTALDVTGSAAPDSTQSHTLRDLEQLALLDRANPLRRMIGELAMAKKLVYRETSDRYQALIDAARKEMTPEALRAVNDFENAIVRQANDLMAELQKIAGDAETGKAQAEAIAAQRKLHLLLLMTLGSTLLLAANLLSEKT